MSEESKEYTAFSADNQYWQFEVTSFGLSNSHLTLVRLMHQVLGDMKGVFAYLHDIIVFFSEM